MSDDQNVERAIVAFGPSGGAVVLFARGVTLESDLEHVSDDAVSIGLVSGDAPDSGVWVWEGIPEWEHGDDGGVPDYTTGEWRKPTEDEWQALRDDIPPWTSAIGEAAGEADVDG